MVFAIGKETVRPTYVVYYHVVFAIGKETVRPTYVVYYHVVYAVGSGLLDPRMSFITTWSMSLVVDLDPYV